MQSTGSPPATALNAFKEHSAMSYLTTIPFYVYKVTCIITTEFYIGSRFIHVKNNTQPEDDLWIKYFTSSSYIHKLLNEYGHDQFNLEFLYYGFDQDNVFWTEQDLIKANIYHPKCVNGHYINQINNSSVFSVYGRLSWINQNGDMTFQKDCPGEGWVRGNQNSGKYVWQKGDQIKFSADQPGDGWTKSSLHKGKPSWINGNVCRYSTECPGPGWIRGHTSSGKHWWFKNGQQKRSTMCPGKGWIKGNAAIIGTTWWSNNGVFIRSLHCPGDGWIKQAPSKGKLSWIKDNIEKKSYEWPGPGWVLGRSNKGKPSWINQEGEMVFSSECPGDGWSKGNRTTATRWWFKDGEYIRSASSPGDDWISQSPNKGMITWTNNNKRKRSHTCPGEGWTKVERR